MAGRASPPRRRDTPPHAPAAPSPAPPLPRGALAIAWGALAFAIVASCARVLFTGFSNDDYLLLDKLAHEPFGRLFGWSGLLVGYWRPLSRELHFWTLLRLAGANPVVFHAANLVLWLGVVALLLVHLARLTNARVAILAMAGAVAASTWGIYVAWACCSQDLWMLLFGAAFLIAQHARRAVLAPVLLALALLSKETALLVLPLALWSEWATRGRAALRPRDWAAPALVVVAWLVAHPALGGNWFFGSGVHLASTPATDLSRPTLPCWLAPVNLECLPAPTGGWIAALPGMLLWAAVTGALAWWAPRAVRGEAESAATRRAWIRLGLGWWAIGWAPFADPALKWHSYYGWLGICGLWVAVVAALASRPRVLAALLLAVALLRTPEARTSRDDWATEAYVLRASGQLERLHAQLRSLSPALPPHSRLFLAGLPGGTGFRTGFRYSAAAHVWYGDTTIVGTTFGDYWPRASGEPAGIDRFYVADTTLKLYPVADARVPVPDSLRASFFWRTAEEQVASQFVDAGEWDRARGNYVRLASAFPDTARYAFNLGVAITRLGDAAGGRRWLDRADSLCGQPPQGGRGYVAAQER